MSILSDALGAVNALRSTYGAPPVPAMLPGRPMDHRNCPVANTLTSGVPGAWASVSEVTIWVTDGRPPESRGTYLDEVTPLAIEMFLEEFDRGAYPELEVDEYRLLPDLEVPE